MKQISTVDYTPQLSQEKDEHGKKLYYQRMEQLHLEEWNPKVV